MNKKDFIELVLKQSGHDGPITGFAVCKECKGKCCYINSCACAPADLGEVSKESVRRFLSSGKYMIALVTAEYENYEGSLPIPIRAIPYIAAREVGANEIHISFRRSKCALLDEHGCTLTEAERPSQGLLVIPKKSKCDQCRGLMPSLHELWEPYLSILDEIVKQDTGKTSQELLEEEFPTLLKELKEKLRNACQGGNLITYNEYEILEVLYDYDLLDEYEMYLWEECITWVIPGYPPCD